MAYLERHFMEDDPRSEPPPATENGEGIRFLLASGQRNEAELAAEQVADLVPCGCSARDVAVIVRHMKPWGRLLKMSAPPAASRARSTSGARSTKPGSVTPFSPGCAGSPKTTRRQSSSIFEAHIVDLGQIKPATCTPAIYGRQQGGCRCCSAALVPSRGEPSVNFSRS